MKLQFPFSYPFQQEWKFWFRLSLAGYLLVQAAQIQAQENSVPVEKGLPVLIMPDESEQAPMPLTDIPPMPSSKTIPLQPVEPAEKDLQEPDKTTAPQQPPVVEQSQETIKPKPSSHNNQKTTWTMLITPGLSSVAGVSADSELVTFQLDEKTGLAVDGPQTQRLGLEAAIRELELVSGDDEPSPHSAVEIVPQSSQGRFPARENYQTLYNSIPFSRAEYLANPAYRHEATMEMMFGQLRPTTIHKQDTPKRIYNLPQLDQGPRGYLPPHPLSWYSPAYAQGGFVTPGYPYWRGINSTYNRYAPFYGPLFNHYYRPLARPLAW